MGKLVLIVTQDTKNGSTYGLDNTVLKHFSEYEMDDSNSVKAPVSVGQKLEMF